MTYFNKSLKFILNFKIIQENTNNPHIINCDGACLWNP